MAGALLSRKVLLAAVLCVLVAGAGAFAWYYFVSKNVAPEETRVYTEGEVRTEIIREDTARYLIDVDYPQFGIPKVDEPIAHGVKTLVEDFKKQAAEAPEGVEYELYATFDGVYIDKDIVSVRLAASTYTGGAHPNTTIHGLNYSIKTGKEIGLSSILKLVGATLEEVAATASAELEKGLGNSFVKEGAEPREENFWTFSISKDAVTFIFDEYQVAPYAAGPQGISFARQDL